MRPNRRILRRIAIVVIVVLVAFLASKAFVGNVYRVGSSSMEPTLITGERVFVRFDDSPPDRFDLVALILDGEALLKRVVGLPFETVSIDLGGDLLIDGKRLPPDAPRPEPILVFDSNRAAIADHFRVEDSEKTLWRQLDGIWELDARSISADDLGTDRGLIGLAKGLCDDHLDESGALVRNEPPVDVGDAILECEFRPLEATGSIVIALDEQGDVFRFTLEIAAGDAGRARLERFLDGALESGETLSTADLSLPSGEWTTLRAANLDNHLSLFANGRLVLSADYAENRFHPRDEAQLGRSYGERVRLGGERAHLQIRNLRVWRDLHYQAPFDPGARRPMTLGLGEYYLLGDHSRASRDSREWGRVEGKAIFGRARYVVWPPQRARVLRSVAPTPSADR